MVLFQKYVRQFDPSTKMAPFQTRWFLCEFPIGFYVKLSTTVQPSWSEGGTTRHNFGRGPSNGYFMSDYRLLGASGSSRFDMVIMVSK
jgi:hypothetical protein